MSKKHSKIPPRQPVSRLAQRAAPPSQDPPAASALAPTQVNRALSERCSERGVAITAENLPVLNAFSEFLEMERQAERRRFRGLLLLFMMLLILAATAALLVGRMLLGQFRGELAQERQRSESVRQHLETELSGVAHAARDLQGKLAVRDRAVRHTYSTLQQHMHGHTTTVASIQDGMSAMEVDMAILENTIRELSQQVRTSPVTSAPATAEPDAPDADLEARIADDFARLRSLTLAQQTQREQTADIADRAVDTNVSAEPQPDAGADRWFAPASMTIETPSGQQVPWRVGSPRRE